jgi:hypothetical protein
MSEVKCPGVLLRLQGLHFPQGVQGVARALPLRAEHEAGVLRDARCGVWAHDALVMRNAALRVSQGKT